MAPYKNKKVDLSFSIVTYNNESIIVDCLNSIFNTIQKRIRFEVFVVDNASSDNTVNIIKKNFASVNLISNNENIGFGRAHNISFKQSKGDFFLVMNPDIILKKGTVEKLINYMKKNKEIGIISPKILNRDGSVQFLCKRYPTLLDLFLRWIKTPLITYFFNKRLDFYVMKNIGYDNIMEVENMTGAFMLIKREAFKKVGGFDENLFLYFEDTDLSRRISKHYKIIYYPYAEVTHLWNKGHYRNLRMFLYYIKSMIYYFNKWGWKIS